ncbi:MAG: hypothetical protein HQL37_07655, partial [Alphaproteobacteria bacterium]|nr:hypothetical protein [Alphaproteobacteria bacterium]
MADSPHSARPEAVPSRRRPVVDSWDVFDTLLARYSLSPTYVFALVEQKSGFEPFSRLRAQAQRLLDGYRRPYTIYQIYRCLEEQLGVEPALARQLLHMEIDLEKYLLLPISRQLARVRRSDLLISDMYLTAEQVTDLVRSIGGLHSVRPPIVGNWGKATGSVWPHIMANFLIRTHHGDNPHSDIAQPAKHHIPVELVDDYKPTAWEQTLLDSDLGVLGLIVREVRLRKLPWAADPFHRVVAGPYCSFLLLFALYLKAYARERNIQKYVFASRDADPLAFIYRYLP